MTEYTTLQVLQAQLSMIEAQETVVANQAILNADRLNKQTAQLEIQKTNVQAQIDAIQNPSPSPAP